MKPILEAVALGQRFGRREVLADLSLTLPPGTITVLLGSNGAGKSTFLRLALGLLRPSAGSVSVCGHDPCRGNVARRSIGFVPDRPDVYGWMTGQELFRFLAPQYPTWNGELAFELAEHMGVPLATRFARLSRGEGTKCMLAAALATSPPLLLLDEPFAGLDPLARDEVLAAFLATLSTETTTTLLATHDLDVASRVADRIALLENGRVQVRPNDAPAGLKELYRSRVSA